MPSEIDVTLQAKKRFHIGPSGIKIFPIFSFSVMGDKSVRKLIIHFLKKNGKLVFQSFFIRRKLSRLFVFLYMELLWKRVYS